MAQKHNQWMRILSAVFITLANLFRNLKISPKEKEEESHSEATSDFGE